MTDIVQECDVLAAHPSDPQRVSEGVADDRIVMLAHDSALHWIVTEQEVIETRSPYPQPAGVAWDVVQQDQLDDIPFLKKLKQDLLAGRSG